MSSATSFTLTVQTVTEDTVYYAIYNDTTEEPVTITTLYHYKDASSSEYTTHDVFIKAGETYSLRIGGLEAGTLYNTKIIAYSSYEDTQMERTASFHTDAGIINAYIDYISSTSFKFHWDTPKSTATKVVVQAKLGSSVIYQNEITTMSITTCVPTGLITGLTYSINLDVYDSSGYCIQMNIFDVTPKKIDPPTINSASWVGNTLKVSWGSVEYAARYRLTVMTGTTMVRQETETGTQLTLNVSSIAQIGLCYVIVNAFDNDNVLSDNSNMVSVERVKAVTPFVIVKKEDGALHKYRVWCRNSALYNAKNIYVRLNGVLRKVKNKYLY